MAKKVVETKKNISKTIANKAVPAKTKTLKSKAAKTTTATLKKTAKKEVEVAPAKKSKKTTAIQKPKVSNAKSTVKKVATPTKIEKKPVATKLTKASTTKIKASEKISISKKSKIEKQEENTLKVSKIETPKLKQQNVNINTDIRLKRKYVKKEDKKEASKIEVAVKNVDVKISTDKPRSVKSILISLPKPDTGKSPYIDIANQFKIKLDWRPFTEVQAIKAIDFRLQKIYIENYKNIIFTSKTSVEQYFRILQELRIKISDDNKYFCINEAIALYLQKYINYRKRKVFFGDGKLPKLMEVIFKNRDKNGESVHLIPSSEAKDKLLTDTLKKYNIEYKEAIIYKTIPSNISDLKNVKYDMLVFFNSTAIDSLYANFPDFIQDKTRLAIYGNSTAETVMKHKLRIDVFAPTPPTPSLADAIKKYITAGNKK
jgi:uroporphyrinogen-III synthase